MSLWSSSNALQPILNGWLKLILTTKGWNLIFWFSLDFYSSPKNWPIINFRFGTQRHLLRHKHVLLSSLYEKCFSLCWQNHPSPTPQLPIPSLALIPLPLSAHVIHQTTVETDASMTLFESTEFSREKYFIWARVAHKFPLTHSLGAVRIFSLTLCRLCDSQNRWKHALGSLSWKWKSWSYFTFIVIVYQYFSLALLLLLLTQTSTKIFEIFIFTLSVLEIYMHLEIMS